MIPFHSFLLLFSAASIMCSLIYGEEIDTGDREEIAKKDTHDDGPLRGNKNVNRTLTVSYKATTIPSQNMEAYMSTVDIIISRGYYAEIHQVTTKDNYILLLHRIPYPKGQTSGPVNGRPVFIQHGFAQSSANFVLLPSEKSLAFILADMGYDVWLGNFRGNTYSRGHVTLDSLHDNTYWKFSFDEMGRYDLPAAFNHVLTVTGRSKLVYIGFSMGTTAFFVCMNYHPEFNDKVELMFAMAPVTTLAHTRAILRYVIPFKRLIQFGPATNFMSKNGPYTKFCLQNVRLAILCHNAAFLIFGTNHGNMDADLIRVFNHHSPAGASVRTLVHFGQNVGLDSKLNSLFNKYDYGWIGNLKHYGKRNPPAYDLSKVTVPVYIFHGANDYVATPKDVEWTASKLANVKKVVLVKDPSFNHFDIIFNRNVKELVYNQVVAFLPPP